MFGFDLGKLFVVGLIALFLVGPDKLPQYAAQLARWVRIARSMTDGAKQRLASEMGPEFEKVDWAGFDPRRYHPRRLLTDAWNAPTESRAARAGAGDGHGSADDADRGEEPDLLALAEARARAETVKGPSAPLGFDLTE